MSLCGRLMVYDGCCCLEACYKKERKSIKYNKPLSRKFPLSRLHIRHHYLYWFFHPIFLWVIRFDWGLGWGNPQLPLWNVSMEKFQIHSLKKGVLNQDQNNTKEKGSVAWKHLDNFISRKNSLNSRRIFFAYLFIWNFIFFPYWKWWREKRVIFWGLKGFKDCC
jgi:hypothetical protein